MNSSWFEDSVRLLVAAAILCFVAQPQSRAQDGAGNRTITLKQAVHMALSQNPAFQTSTDEADAARARLKEVKSAWFPRFDFHQDFTRGNNPVYVFGSKLTQRQFTAADFALNNLNSPTPLDNFQTRFDGQWRLFDSGQTLFHQRSAKRLVTAADFETEQARQDLNYFLIVVTVGGTSSITGPFFASILLGIGDVAGKYYVPKLGAFVIYAIMIAVLILRPQGLFARSTAR